MHCLKYPVANTKLQDTHRNGYVNHAQWKKSNSNIASERDRMSNLTDKDFRVAIQIFKEGEIIKKNEMEIVESSTKST